MRQLDLFSSLFDSPPVEKEMEGEQADSIKQPLEEPLIIDEEVEEKGAAPKEAVIVTGNDNTIAVSVSGEFENGTVYNDGKISVKIKARPKPVETVSKSVAEEVKTISKPTNSKTKNTKQKRGRKSFKEIDAELDLVEIPADEILYQKQYYPISQVAGWFHVNTSLIRFWENEFDIVKPRKNRKGDRLFRPDDVKNLQLIYELLRQRKYTIEGAKEYIKGHKQKADMQLQLTNTLKKFKNFLLELKATLHT